MSDTPFFCLIGKEGNLEGGEGEALLLYNSHNVGL